MYAGIAASFPASYPTLSRVPLRAYNSRTWHNEGLPLLLPQGPMAWLKHFWSGYAVSGDLDRSASLATKRETDCSLTLMESYGAGSAFPLLWRSCANVWKRFWVLLTKSLID